MGAPIGMALNSHCELRVVADSDAGSIIVCALYGLIPRIFKMLSQSLLQFKQRLSQS